MKRSQKWEIVPIRIPEPGINRNAAVKNKLEEEERREYHKPDTVHAFNVKLLSSFPYISLKKLL